jgi:septum formation protein
MNASSEQFSRAAPGPIQRTRPLLLGSASPRRSGLLSSLGLPFLVLPADIVEDALPGESPAVYLERIAEGKFRAVQRRLGQEQDAAAAAARVAAILVADTTVVIDEQIVGKPADVEEAVLILSRLVGRSHTVFTRYVVGAAAPKRLPVSGSEHPRDEPLQAESADVYAARTVRTEVKLRAASPAEIRAYAATGEGLDKAGAYAAQGLGAFLVEAVIGSYTNVVGLPVCELIADLGECGLLPAFPDSFL